MCSDLSLLCNIQIIKPPIQVFLPNGETLEVNCMGKAILSFAITLCDVLYLLAFKFNLTSINILSSFHFIFIVSTRPQEPEDYS